MFESKNGNISIKYHFMCHQYISICSDYESSGQDFMLRIMSLKVSGTMNSVDIFKTFYFDVNTIRKRPKNETAYAPQPHFLGLAKKHGYYFLKNIH